MARRARYRQQYGLGEKEAAVLTADRDLCFFYERCIEAALARREGLAETDAARACTKLLLNAGAKRANERGCSIEALGITPEQVAQIIELRGEDAIGSSAADELFGLLGESDEPALAVAEQHGLLQVRDEGLLEAWCEQAVAAQPEAAADFRRGKKAAIGRLVGEVMKVSRGQADAKEARERLVEKLRR